MNNSEKIANPTKYFDMPEGVIEDGALSTEEKIKLFENWLDEIMLKNIAEEENMASEEPLAPDYTAIIHELLATLR